MPQPVECTPYLPVEIKLQIVENVQLGGGLLELLASDWTFCHLCQPILYRWFVLTGREMSDIIRTIKWCRTIVSNLRLALFVQELDLRRYRRRNARWIAGGAMERLLLKAMARVKNLRMFRLKLGSDWSRSPLLIDIANLEFPQLESFQGQTTFSFLKLHQSIKYLCLPEIEFLHEQEGVETAKVLPNLLCYWGGAHIVNHLDPKAPLLRLGTARGDWDETGEAESLLRACGSNLRNLCLYLGSWKEGDFGTVAELAPNVHTLQINLGYSTVSPIQGIINDILSSKVKMKSLEHFELLGDGFFGHAHNNQNDNQETYVHQLYKTFPSLRLIRLSESEIISGSYPFGKVSKVGWRYHETSRIWIPPPTIRGHLKVTTEQEATMAKQYEEALPEPLDIQKPVMDWHFLVPRS